MEFSTRSTFHALLTIFISFLANLANVRFLLRQLLKYFESKKSSAQLIKFSKSKKSYRETCNCDAKFRDPPSPPQHKAYPCRKTMETILKR